MTVFNGNNVKHGELSVEQISDIKKSIIVSLRSKDKFWDAFCSHDRVGDGYTAYEWRKLNIDKVTDATIRDLTEGVTPDGLSLSYVNFKVTPVDFGTFIPYTDKAKKYNYDNVVQDAKVVLAQDAHDVGELKKCVAYISGTCTMDLNAKSVAKHFLKDLLKARTILKKNNVKPISGGKFGCIVAPEVSAEILLDYEQSITHTSQREALINGYLGELGGFILYENSDAPMYRAASAAVAGTPLANAATGTAGVKYYTRAASSAGAGYLNDGTYAYTLAGEGTAVTADAANKFYPLTSEGNDLSAYVLFIGKTEYGMPVKTVAFGDDSVKVIDSGLGNGAPQVEVSDGSITAVKGDPLEQRGTVGYKVQGFATSILFDEAVIRGEYKLGEVEEITVTDSNRKHYQAKSTSPAA